MDSLDLIAREDEFKKLNKQLEKKTESLMKEIEHVMQKQDIFSEFSHNLTISPHNTPSKKHFCEKPKTSDIDLPLKSQSKISIGSANILKKKLTKDCNQVSQEKKNKEVNKEEKRGCECCKEDLRRERIDGDLEFLYAFVTVSVKENVLPASFMKERVTVENVCKFLSSKVKLMQEQIDKLQSTINTKASQCEAHLTHQAELEGERLTLINRTNNLQANLNDLRAKNAALTKRLEEKDRLYKEQRSESDKLSSEVKRLKSSVLSAAAHRASLEDTVDSLRHQITTAKTAEKEFRENTRSLSASHSSTVAQLEAKIKTLNTCIYRQKNLIENLKQQRALMTAEGAVKLLEKEFKEFLNSDF